MHIGGIAMLRGHTEYVFVMSLLQRNYSSSHLHAVKGRPIPVRPLVGLGRHRLHVIEEQAAAGRFQGHHHEAGADLQHARDDAAEVDGNDAQAVVHAEQNGNCTNTIS